jgi:hypothetical protein
MSKVDVSYALETYCPEKRPTLYRTWTPIHRDCINDPVAVTASLSTAPSPPRMRTHHTMQNFAFFPMESF